MNSKYLADQEMGNIERENDLRMAEEIQRRQVEEDRAIRSNDLFEKEKNAAAQLEQSNIKNHQNQIEALFV